MQRSLCFIGSTLLCGAVGSAASAAIVSPGNWQAPAGGWQAVYDASDNLLPSQLSGSGASKIWNNQQPRLPDSPGYQFTDPTGANYAGLDNDALTNERVLIMRHSNNTVNPVFTLNTPPGSGTTTDKITLDVRFRLLTDLPTTPTTSNIFPLFIDVTRPPTAAQLAADPGADEQFLQLRFRENNLIVLGVDGSGAPVTFASNVVHARQWHDLRMHWDVDGGAQFFINGAATPMTFTGGLTTLFPRVNNAIVPGTENNMISFGDSGSGVTGQSSLAYIQVTSGDLASTIPEPGSIAAGLVVGAGLMRRRKHAN